MLRYDNTPASAVIYDPAAPPPRRPKRDCTKIVLSDEQTEWLKAHFADTLNADCCERLGISKSTLARFVRALGLKKTPEFMHEQQLMSCHRMHLINSGEGNAGKANLIKHGAAHRFKKGVTPRQRLGEDRDKARIAKMRATRLETIRKERMRINWGLPQQTKIKLTGSEKQRQLRYSLKRRGYIVPTRGAVVIYYTPATTRSTIVERHATEHGLAIEQYQHQ